MTDDRRGLEHESPPPATRTGRLALIFAVAGGPLAWLVQLNTNYGLLGQPCYPGPDRNAAIPNHSLWVWPVALAIYIFCLVIALLSAIVAISVYRRALAGDPQGRDSRNCFLGFSGIICGLGFSAVIFANIVALITVPPCAM
jgi:hypothetical protein